MRQLDDVICLSHLRWNFVFQRPNHLMSRCARSRRVFFFEEPMFDGSPNRLEVKRTEQGPFIVTPHFSDATEIQEAVAQLPKLASQLLSQAKIDRYLLWYYTPMAVEWTRHLKPALAIYDCMDDLSTFKGAHPRMLKLEAELFRRVQLVFTGGQSLYQAKRPHHPNVHAFPSSVDVPHFAKARLRGTEPLAQAAIPHPRIGYFGVIDERLDLGLIADLAELRPDWHWVMVGPLAKLSPETLPKAPNLHYLGGKNYAELPRYLAGWGAAFMPFALNEATRFISPTKTPEFLAAGLPVVSTPIADVVEPYGNRGLVKIACDAQGFVAAIEALCAEDPKPRRKRADAFISQMSWDLTWERMSRLIDAFGRSQRPHLDGQEAITAV